jgi:asparagine synthase (glutamine-hydrolysing)
MEKYIIRKAFDIARRKALPPRLDPLAPEGAVGRRRLLVDRRHEGVRRQQHFRRAVCQARRALPYQTPDTKEAYWIREIFDQQFPSQAAAETAVRWVPKQEWGVSSDPRAAPSPSTRPRTRAAAVRVDLQ